MIAGWTVMIRNGRNDWALHSNRKIYLAQSIALGIATQCRGAGGSVVRVHLSGPGSQMIPTEDSFEHAEAMSVAWMEHAQLIRSALRGDPLVLR